jgi:ribonucleotide reductase beta subunit family protein with ferritin-like domain
MDNNTPELQKIMHEALKCGQTETALHNQWLINNELNQQILSLKAIIYVFATIFLISTFAIIYSLHIQQQLTHSITNIICK